MAKTVLITGCSTGLGRLTAKTFQAQGWNVVATMRTPEKESELNQLDNLLLTRLDVTDQASIEQAIASAVDAFGSIDVLVNNAGYGGHAAVEQASDEMVRRMFDTNVFGVFNTTRSIVPLFRKQGSGTIVNVTSMAGMIGIPLESAYCASKWAVEGFTEALALECRDLNIKVHSILPGAYATSFGNNLQDNLGDGDQAIVDHSQRLMNHFGAVVAEHHSGQQPDGQEVADMVYQCATEDMPVHNPCGSDAVFLQSLSEGPSRQVFYDNLSALLLPPA